MPTTTTNTTSQTKTNLTHLKHHVTYPTDRKGLITACSNMSDVPEGDRAWITETIPEGNYRGPEDVMKALIAKV